MLQPRHTSLRSGYERVVRYLSDHLNFFRIHIIAFTVIPLVFSVVFWAANGQFKVSFIDSLFVCYSAGTVTGLSTINLSTITGFQQAILYVLMLLGDYTVVSLVMVLVRKRFFRVKCESLLKHDRLRRTATMASRSETMPADDRTDPRSLRRRLSRLIISEPTRPVLLRREVEADQQRRPAQDSTEATEDGSKESSQKSYSHAHEAAFAGPVSSSTESISVVLPPLPPQIAPGDARITTPQSQSITFSSSTAVTSHPPVPPKLRVLPHPVMRTGSLPIHPPQRHSSMHEDLGGFPNPLGLLAEKTMQILLPTGVRQRIARPVRRELTLVSTFGGLGEDNAAARFEKEKIRPSKWISFDGLRVGRNSRFALESLSDEQMEEIGGVEYSALRVLSYLIAVYFIATQLLCLLVFYPYLQASSKWDSVFEAQPRLVPKSWFSVFQVMSAYTGGGLSLVDLSMLPFSNCYPMVMSLSIVILCGNHAMPIFLRLLIWLGTKLVRTGSQADVALHFLLDHPRRCFLYLFPSHQTWYLLIVLAALTSFEVIAFGVLNIGLEPIESIPVGQRISDAWLQSIAVRASGFAIVPTGAVAPALQLAWIVLMYIAVYPIALSVRATNTYEEKALGIYVQDDSTKSEVEPELNGTRSEMLGQYLRWHARRQLAFDIWPLMLGIWLIGIIERGKILNEDNFSYFTQFRIIFEAVSGYAGIGLSLGLPDQNYSFSGAYSVGGKLVMIALMLRGRQRGLPQAIDRAIQLPHEFRDDKPEPPHPS